MRDKWFEPLERFMVPVVLGGVAHGTPVPRGPAPVIPEPEQYAPNVHMALYDPCYYWDGGRTLIRFFALRDSTEGMREGWLRSWRRSNPDALEMEP